MKETLIYKLNKHNIYYISTPSYGFYILVPFTDYTDTNIVLRLKGNYQSYDLNKNSLESVTEELINYYKSIDNYNVTLVLPIFYDGILDRIRTVEDLVLYQRLDGYLGNIFNNAYAFLTKNNIKVNSNIYIINNDSFKTFTNWFVSRYNNSHRWRATSSHPAAPSSSARWRGRGRFPRSSASCRRAQSAPSIPRRECSAPRARCS